MIEAASSYFRAFDGGNLLHYFEKRQAQWQTPQQ
jgi:hypothetical protein